MYECVLHIDKSSSIFTVNQKLPKTLWRWGEGVVRDSGKVMYTPLYLKWITNKDLLYSTWNSAQCHVPQLGWEGGWEENGCVYVWLSPFTFHVKLPQRCQSAISQYKVFLD